MKGVRAVWVDREGNAIRETERRDFYSLPALVVEFRNEPPIEDRDAVMYWHNVEASISYFDQQGEEKRHVNHGTWLKHSGIMVDFSKFESQVLVIAVREKENEWRTGENWDQKVLNPAAVVAKVVLHDQRGEFMRDFAFQIDLKRGTIAPMPL